MNRLLFVFLLLPSFLKAQGPQKNLIDSLVNELPKLKEDTNKVNLLEKLSGAYYAVDPDKGVACGLQGLKLAKQLHWEKGSANINIIIGVNYWAMGDYYKALECYQESLKTYEQLGDKKGMARALGNIGLVYIDQDNYPKALECHLRSLGLFEELGEKPGVANSLSQIGGVYLSEGNYPKALEYLQKAMKMNEELGNKLGVANALGNMALIFSDQGEYDHALEYSFKALSINESLGNPRGIESNLGRIGLVYHYQKKYEQAIEYAGRSVKIGEEIGDKKSVAADLCVLGIVYTDIAKDQYYRSHPGPQIPSARKDCITRAMDCFNKSIVITREIGDIYQLHISLMHRSEAEALDGNYATALESFKESSGYRDSIYNREKIGKIITTQMQFDFDKKQLADSLKNAEGKKIAALKLSSQQKYTYTGFLSAFAILGFGSLSFYRYRKQKKSENQQLLLNERLRISRDLHDDMGATLSSISVYSSAVKQRLNDDKLQEAHAMLDIISVDAQDMVGNMSDMVWVINPQNDTMEKLLNRIELFASNVLGAKNIMFHFTVDETLKSIFLPVEVRKNIFLIFKEAINNSAKYARPKEVHFSLLRQRKEIIMAIADDGCGWDTKTAVNGNGIRNMKQRAEELKAVLVVESAVGMGTTISLTVDNANLQ